MSRWLILAVAWAAFLVSFVDRLAWSNVAPQFAGTFSLSIVTLGVFVTTFYVGYVASNILAGFAGDLAGPRATLAVSLLCLGVATLLFGLAQGVAVALALQALMGLSAGADYAAGVKLIATWFPRLERGRAMGLFMTATSAAVVLSNLLVPAIIDHFSWRMAYLVLGVLTAALGLVAFAVVRDSPVTGVQPRPDYLRLVQNRQLLLLGLAGFGALWGTWGFAFWAGILMVTGHGLSATQSGFVVALYGGGAIVAKPCIGLLSDLLGGRRRALAIACLLFFVAMLLGFSQLENFAAFAAAAPLLGVGAFGYSPLMNTMVAEAAGPGMAASGAGFTNAFWGLGSVVVPLVVGAAYGSTGSFALPFVVLATGPLLAAGCMAFTQDVPEADTAVSEVFR